MTAPRLRLPGAPGGRYYRLVQRDAKTIGLFSHPSRPEELHLRAGADPDAVVVLPDGTEFTAKALTELSHKRGDTTWWEIWVGDTGGYPSTPLDAAEYNIPEVPR